MANKNQVFGQATIRYNGVVMKTDKGATLDVGGTSRESVEGDYSAGGFQESTKPAKLDYSAFITPDTNVSEVGKIDDATVTFEADTGQVWLMRNAYHGEPPVINQGDGKFSGSFMSPPAEQVQV